MLPLNSVRKHGDTAIAAAAALLVAAPLAILLAQAPAPTAPGQNGGKAQGKGQAKGGGGGLYQRQPPTPTGPAPKFADGTPDLSGVWNGGGSNDSDISRGLKAGEAVVMLPWAEALVKTRKSKDDPEANCLPAGIPRGSPYPWRIVQTPGIYFIVFEGNIHSFRQIFMDGRKHPEDLDPTWYGHSIGHWDGQTLVVDTVGFNDKFWFDYMGHPHTEKLHTIERYTRTDLGNMAIEVTIDDPGAYTKPFTTVGRARIMAGTELLEYICQEENTDVEHLSGPALGPGGGGR
jgi:hypothetical protein